jgi:hypothetical protein
MFFEVIAYILLAVVVAWLARRTEIGFVGFLILSLVFTPVLTLLILMVARERRPPRPA